MYLEGSVQKIARAVLAQVLEQLVTKIVQPDVAVAVWVLRYVVPECSRSVVQLNRAPPTSRLA